MRSVLGVIGNGDSGSMKVSIVRGRLFTKASSSHNRVRNGSSSKLWPCCFISAAIMFGTDQICHSQAAPKFLAVAGFLIQWMLCLSSIHSLEGSF